MFTSVQRAQSIIAHHANITYHKIKCPNTAKLLLNILSDIKHHLYLFDIITKIKK